MALRPLLTGIQTSRKPHERNCYYVDRPRRFGKDLLKALDQAGRGAAKAQLKDWGYADEYRDLLEPLHLVAGEFSNESRNVGALQAETVNLST